MPPLNTGWSLRCERVVELCVGGVPGYEGVRHGDGSGAPAAAAFVYGWRRDSVSSARRVGVWSCWIPNGFARLPCSRLFEQEAHSCPCAEPSARLRPLASDPEEGSIAPLIVGMLALLLLIGFGDGGDTGAYLQTQHLQDVADAQANSTTRTMRTLMRRADRRRGEAASAFG